MMKVKPNETLKEKERRLENYFIDWEEDIIERETRLENIYTSILDLHGFAKIVLNNAKELKQAIHSDLKMVKFDSEEDNILYYSEKHVIFCEEILRLISKLQNDLKDDLDLD
jgi:hypothetical protein